MPPIGKNLRQEYRALKKFGLWALGCHVAVFTLFSFSFSPRPLRPQPELFFWGSILTRQDVLSPLFSDGMATYAMPIPLVSRRISRSKVNPVSVTAVPKPRGETPGLEQKTIIKTFFEIFSFNDKPAEKESSSLEKDDTLAVPKLRPAGVYQAGRDALEKPKL